MSKTVETLTPEMLLEAFDACHGLLFPAIRYLKKVYGVEYNRYAIESRIEMWGMKEAIYDIRRGGTEDVLCAKIKKAMQGDNASSEWYLNRYGHHAGYLDMQDSSKGVEKEKAVMCQIIDGLAREPE